MPEAALHLSCVAGSPLVDSAGERLGRVSDVIARLDGEDPLPLVSGLKARIGGREMFVPAERIAALGPQATRTSTTKLNLASFERRPGEVLLVADLLGHSLINVGTARLVHAGEVELVGDGGRWRVAGIDASLGARLRRLLPRPLRTRDVASRQFVAWPEMEPLLGHVPTARLRLGHRRLAQLHPAQIADLVEAASHEEGEEIMEAVGEDKELEADVFEELDDEHQLEFLRERSDREVAAVLGRMAPDDAADLLVEIDQDRRLPVLNLVPATKRLKIKGLLGYNPSTAGGLMNPDYLAVGQDATAAVGLEKVRASTLAEEQSTTVFVLDADGCLQGVLPVVTLIRSASPTPIASLIEPGAPTVAPEADIPEIARLMTDYNLTCLPVVDGDERPIGAVWVDDVIELTLPADWRRRFGRARG